MFPYCFFSFYSRLPYTLIEYKSIHYLFHGVIDVIQAFYNYSHSIFICKSRRFFEPAFERCPYQRWKFLVIRDSYYRSPLNMFALREEYQV